MKLISVTNPKGFRIEGPILVFDEVVTIAEAAALVVRAYQKYLNEKDVKGKVHSFNTTDVPRLRSYGFAVTDQRWRGPLYELVSGDKDTNQFTFTSGPPINQLDEEDKPFFISNRMEIFRDFIGLEI